MRWIHFRFEVGVGAVALHVEIVFGFVGIAPLFVLADGERERGVEHGVEDVDEWDVGDDELGRDRGACS